MDQSKLKEILEYNEYTGEFTWLCDRHARKVKGLRAGWETGKSEKRATSYREIRFKNKIYKEHRLAFLYMTGSIPDIVDHIDGNGLNNKWSNLRAVNATDSARNKPIQKNNKSGIPGVSYYKKLKKWRAAISVNGKKKHLGYFDEIDEAAERRLLALNEFGYHKNHGRKQ